MPFVKIVIRFPCETGIFGKTQTSFVHLLIFKMLCFLEFVVTEVFCWNQQYSGYRAVFTISYTVKCLKDMLGMGAVQMESV